MQVLKPIRLVREKRSLRPLVQDNKSIAPVKTVTKPLVYPAVDAGISEAIAAADEMLVRCKMPLKGCEDIPKKADSVELLFYDGAGKKRRLPIGWPHQSAVLIVAVECVLVRDRVLARPTGEIV